MKRFNLMKKIFSVLLTAMIAITAIGLIKVNAEEEYSITYNEDEHVYYSDGYFKDPSTTYNSHLATISMQMANRSAPAGSPASNDATDEWYKTQYKSIQTFYDRIGFSGFAYNEDYTKKTAFDTIGVACAQRKATFKGKEYTIVAVVPRSGNYGLEWANNMALGNGDKSDNLHEGWYNAANKLITFLKNYVDNNVTTENVKLWMAGFSRGGATTNIAAALLDNDINNEVKIFGDTKSITRDDIYAYTLEAPQGANVNVRNMPKPKNYLYNNIFNIINPNDLVPKVAMMDYGFTRFGIDKYITTQFYDPINYNLNRNVFFKMLTSHDLMKISEYKADDFDMYGMSVLSVLSSIGALLTFKQFMDPEFVVKDNTKVAYDSNITVTLLIHELTKNIGTREQYAVQYQPQVCKLMEEFMDGYMPKLGDAVASLPGLLGGMIFGVIAYAVTGRKDVMDTLMHDMFGKYVLDKDLTHIVELFCFIVGPLISTYWERPNELISVMKNIVPIFQNHSTEVTFAHLMSQDSYYIDAYNAATGETLNVVPLRENADYGKMVLDGFNDLKIYEENTLIADIEGYVWGKSEVHKYTSHIAMGYYSYTTEERIEVFLPVDRPFSINYKDYSKKFYHQYTFNAYHMYYTLGNENVNCVNLASFQDHCYFNSDRFYQALKF